MSALSHLITPPATTSTAPTRTRRAGRGDAPANLSASPFDGYPRVRGKSVRLDDPNVARAVRLLVDDPEEVLPAALGLSEAQLIAAHQEAARQERRGAVDPARLAKALKETARSLGPQSKPANLTAGLDELAGHAAFTATMRGALADAEAARHGNSGPRPNFETSLAHMLMLVNHGGGAHLRDSHEVLTGHREARTALAKILDLDPAWTPGSYGASLRNMTTIAPHLALGAMRTNIELLKALSTKVPNVGRWLAIDGSNVPAWCLQRHAKKDSPLDAALRRNTPDAGFRFMDKNPPVLWRGYWLVTIVDIATGLPVVWTLMDASVQETDATEPLLKALMTQWPKLQPKALVADKGWDSEKICKMLVENFGIHPVIPLRADSADTPLTKGDTRDGTIAMLDNLGRMVCAAHRNPIPIKYVEGMPSRAGLAPGQAAPKQAARVRGRCDQHTPGETDNCGHVNIAMRINYRKLTYFPHHPEGHATRYAQRIALLHRRNAVEGLFNRLKTGHSLGTAGADRLRLKSRESYEALISLAFFTMTTRAAITEHIDPHLPDTPAADS